MKICVKVSLVLVPGNWGTCVGVCTCNYFVYNPKNYRKIETQRGNIKIMQMSSHCLSLRILIFFDSYSCNNINIIWLYWIYTVNNIKY